MSEPKRPHRPGHVPPQPSRPSPMRSPGPPPVHFPHAAKAAQAKPAASTPQPVRPSRMPAPPPVYNPPRKEAVQPKIAAPAARPSSPSPHSVEALRRAAAPAVPVTRRQAGLGIGLQRIVQRALVNQADPSGFLFIHHTISPTFSQGATLGSPGEHLDKVANDIREGTTDPMDFPALPIFTIDDPDGELGTETFSLSNRRLYVFKSANVTNVRIRAATFQEVLDSLWKMTNESGGFYYPKLTQFGKKDVEPGGLLGKFKRWCLALSGVSNLEQRAVNLFNFRMI